MKSFEACAAFTHVMVCLLAESPTATLCSSGFGDLVPSIAAPIATGGSESCRGGMAPPENRRLGTAHIGAILAYFPE